MKVHVMNMIDGTAFNAYVHTIHVRFFAPSVIQVPKCIRLPPAHNTLV